MLIKPPIIYRKRIRKEEESEYGSKWIEYAFKDHVHMSERLKKTLYYGRQPKTDRPSLPMTEIAVEIFSQAVPQSLGDINMNFAASVSRNACMSPCSIILAMAYLERLRSRRPEYLQNMSSSNLFLVSMLVASKFLYDEGEDEEVFNDEWAMAANIETKEMNDLEMKFLSAIDWNVYLEPRYFNALLADMERAVAGRKSKDRGWCTYTDIDVLTNRLDYAWCWRILSDLIIKVITVSAIAYTASVLVIVGSVIVSRHTQRTVKQMVPPPSSDLMENELSCVVNERVSEGMDNDNCSQCIVMEWGSDLLVNRETKCRPADNGCSMYEDDRGANDDLRQSIINKINVSSMASYYLVNVNPYVDLSIAPAFR